MLYKRSGPTWWVRFRVRGVEVRRSTGSADKNQAEDFERKLRDDAWRQSRLGQVCHTWDEATARWLKERASKRSIAKDRAAFATVAEYLNGAALDEIDRAALSKLRQVLEESPATTNSAARNARGRKPSTVLRLMGIIRAVLRACVTWGWTTDTPLISMPKVERTEPRFITREEFDRLYDELPAHLQSMARFSVETGQRYSAVAKLQWSAVDLVRQHAFITSSTSKNKRPLPLPLNSAALVVLEAQAGKHATYVFTDHLGRAPMRGIRKAWSKACKRAGLEGLRWHDLRHSWASWHTQSGTPPIVLKELGGWSSLALVEHYSHLSAPHLAAWAGNTGGTKTGSGRSRKAPKVLNI